MLQRGGEYTLDAAAVDGLATGARPGTKRVNGFEPSTFARPRSVAGPGDGEIRRFDRTAQDQVRRKQSVLLRGHNAHDIGQIEASGYSAWGIFEA